MAQLQIQLPPLGNDKVYEVKQSMRAHKDALEAQTNISQLEVDISEATDYEAGRMVVDQLKYMSDYLEKTLRLSDEELDMLWELKLTTVIVIFKYVTSSVMGAISITFDEAVEGLGIEDEMI